MNRFALLVCAVSAAVCSFAETNHVAEAAHGTGTLFRFAPARISFTLPYYWQVIADEKLAGYKETLRETFPGRPVPNYVLALQRRALFTFALPYALFEIEERSMPTPQELESERQSFADSVRRAYMALRQEGLFGEVKPLDAIYDARRHVIVGYWEMMRASDKRRIAAMAAIFPCRYGYLRAHFFLPAERQDEFLPAVEEIINSVTFDEGYGYEPGRGTRARRGLAPRTALLILAALFAAWFALRLAVRSARKR